MSTMALIEIQSLRHSYQVGTKRVWAIDGVNLEIQAGEFVAVIGPSGSGKSTLLHLIGCLSSPISGSYKLDGIDVSRLGLNELATTRNRKLGFVFQNFNLLPRMSALDNVQLPLLYARMPSRERRRRAGEALNSLGLGDLARRSPAQLSGGEQQRVAIARALVNEPLLLLADEPTGSLDSSTSKQTMKIFERLNRKKGVTILLVTHEPDVAAHARRVVALRDGRIISDKCPQPKRRGSRRAKTVPKHAAV
jgi:putative ABC transport system ATP-binding protein